MTVISLVRRVVGGSAMVAMVAAGLTAIGPGASAAPLDHGRGASVMTRSTFVIPAGASVATLNIGSARVQAIGSPLTAISCTLNVYNPLRYYGGPYGGGEEGIANIQCNQAATQLFIEVALFRNGAQVTYNSNTNYGNYFINVDTEYPVSAGIYKTGADGTLSSAGVTYSAPYTESASIYLS